MPFAVCIIVQDANSGANVRARKLDSAGKDRQLVEVASLMTRKTTIPQVQKAPLNLGVIRALKEAVVDRGYMKAESKDRRRGRLTRRPCSARICSRSDIQRPLH